MADSAAIAALKEAWRDYATDDVPASGANEPDKEEIRAGLSLLNSELSAALSGMTRFATVAAMNAVTDSEDGELAYVYNNNGDPADPANGVYQWNDGGSVWETADWYFNAVAAVAQTFVDEAEAAQAAAEAAQAAAEAAAASVRYTAGILLTEADGVLEGGYVADPFMTTGADIARLYADVLDGTGSFDATVLVDGVVVHGPVTVEDGTPVTDATLTLAAAEGSEVSIAIHNVADEVNSLVVQIDGTLS